MKNFYKNIKKMPIKFWLFIALCIFATPLIIHAIGTTDEGYECLPGTSRTITEHTVCKQVHNAGADSYFIPTKTAQEWSDFIAAVPSLPDISLSECVGCTPHDYTDCYNNDVYWFDSCGGAEEKTATGECGSDSASGSWYCLPDNITRQRDVVYHDRGCAGGACYDNVSSDSATDVCEDVFYDGKWYDGRCDGGVCVCPYYYGGPSPFGPYCGGDSTCCHLGEGGGGWACSASPAHYCGYIEGQCCDSVGELIHCCEGFFWTGHCMDYYCQKNPAFCWPEQYIGCNDPYGESGSLEGDIHWYNSCDEIGELIEDCDYGCGTGVYAENCFPFAPTPPVLSINPLTIEVGETVDMSWTSVPGAETYRGRVYDSVASEWGEWVDLGAPTSYSDVQLNDAGTWSYQVQACKDGLCTWESNTATVCVYSCAGKVCGDDGCGDSCGDCAFGTYCNATGQCCYTTTTCTDADPDLVCGVYDDLCGGTVNCGSCAAGTYCNASGQCCYTSASCNDYSIDCGVYDNLCGGTINCGNCSPVGGVNTYCVAGKCCATCQSCYDLGLGGVDTGYVDNQCGGTINCKDCP